jgi:hypothetical protein
MVTKVAYPVCGVVGLFHQRMGIILPDDKATSAKGFGIKENSCKKWDFFDPSGYLSAITGR